MFSHLFFTGGSYDYDPAPRLNGVELPYSGREGDQVRVFSDLVPINFRQSLSLPYGRNICDALDQFPLEPDAYTAKFVSGVWYVNPYQDFAGLVSNFKKFSLHTNTGSPTLEPEKRELFYRFCGFEAVTLLDIIAACEDGTLEGCLRSHRRLPALEVPYIYNYRFSRAYSGHVCSVSITLNDGASLAYGCSGLEAVANMIGSNRVLSA